MRTPNEPPDVRLNAAVRQLRHQHPHADPSCIARVVIDTRDGLAAFGFRDDERTAALITEIAASDPRLHIGHAGQASRRD